MTLDSSVPGFPELDDWPTPLVRPACIEAFGLYRDGGPQGGTFYVALRDAAGQAFPFFFDRFLGRLCYGRTHDGGDDAAYIRKGSRLESEAFAAIEAAAVAAEFSEVAERLGRARHWTRL